MCKSVSVSFKKNKKLAVGSKFPFLPQTVCLLKNIESAAAARVVQTYTHALLSLSISCQFSTTLRSIQSASRTGRQSVGCARRGNSWPPLSTHWGYLVWHQLPATGVSLPNAACGRKNGKTEPKGQVRQTFGWMSLKASQSSSPSLQWNWRESRTI